MRQRLRRGLDLLIRPERMAALWWARLRFDERPDAREPLFNLYAPLARRIAARQRPYGVDGAQRDAEQWAYSGLLEAIDNFDPLRGPPFEAYARPRIVGAVRDGFARLTEIGSQISQRRRIERERLATLKDSDEASGDAIERLTKIAAGLAIGLLLDGTRLLATDNDADPAPSAYDTLASRQLEQKIAAAIDQLSAREAAVIRQHYEHGLSFAQIADLLGLTRGRISQLHSAALFKLRKRLSKEY